MTEYASEAWSRPGPTFRGMGYDIIITYYFGHVMQHPEMYPTDHRTKEDHKDRVLGRRSTSWLKNVMAVRHWYGQFTVSLLEVLSI